MTAMAQLTDPHMALMQADAQRHRWADEFSQQPENQWASEFERTQTGAAASISGTDSQTAAAARGDTKALADLLSRDANPKMKNSKFLQFISKMSRGEIILEDNEVSRLLLSSKQRHLFALRLSQIPDEYDGIYISGL